MASTVKNGIDRLRSGNLRRRRWAQSPTSHTVGHVDHKKRVMSVSIFMHACDPVPVVIVIRLAALCFQCEAYRVNYENLKRSSCVLRL